MGSPHRELGKEHPPNAMSSYREGARDREERGKKKSRANGDLARKGDLGKGVCFNLVRKETFVRGAENKL